MNIDIKVHPLYMNNDDLMLSLDILSKTGMLFSMLIGLTVASLRLPENAHLILDIFFLVISA